MKRVTQIRFVGNGQGQGASRALLTEVGDVALDFREVPRTLVMKCPDGCGQMLSINLDKRSGKAWRLYVRDDKLTLYPSVWRDDGCKAHFILWKGYILWCDRESTISWKDRDLTARVSKELDGASPNPMNFLEIAQKLDAIPWEVLWACEALVRTRHVLRLSDSEFLVPKP